jgi:hypothetical protein
MNIHLSDQGFNFVFDLSDPSKGSEKEISDIAGNQLNSKFDPHAPEKL